MAAIEIKNISSVFHDSCEDNNNMDSRALEKKKRNREFVIKKFEKGKYVSEEKTFENEDDEREFESYREDMLREYDTPYIDDWSGYGVHHIELYIVKCWVGMVIDKWRDEEEAESKSRKKKTTEELIEEKCCDLPLPAVFSTKPSPLQLKEPW